MQWFNLRNYLLPTTKDFLYFTIPLPKMLEHCVKCKVKQNATFAYFPVKIILKLPHTLSQTSAQLCFEGIQPH